MEETFQALFVERGHIRLKSGDGHLELKAGQHVPSVVKKTVRTGFMTPHP
mgnify:CR=1 FL=1